MINRFTNSQRLHMKNIDSTENDLLSKRIKFSAMTADDLPLWEKWIEYPHVKDVWFIEGYESQDYVHEKLKGNGFDYPFIVSFDDHPIGYIQCSDLYTYRTQCPNPEGLFLNEGPGAWCMDLFIAEEQYLNKGYGTQIVRGFVRKMVNEFAAKKILIDPATSNKRAIRCYEKVGFQFERTANDGITDCTVMKIVLSGDV